MMFKRIFVAMAAFVAVVSSARAGVYYVDQAATGSGDGSSWENAFTTLPSAIAAATAEGDEIRVKFGDMTITETIVIENHPGLAIRGGYTGEGDAREGRSNIQRDNASNLRFRIFAVTASKIVFDGLGINNGRLDDTTGILGLGVCLQSACEADFNNCSFTNNRAVNGNSGWSYTWGGALYADGGTLSIADCVFDDNAITFSRDGNHCGWGGALYAKSAAVSIVRTRFANNVNATAHARSLGGGAIALDTCDNALIDGCHFATNRMVRNFYSNDFGTLSVGGSVYVANSSGLVVRDTVDIGSYVMNEEFSDSQYRTFGFGQVFYLQNTSAVFDRVVLFNRDAVDHGAYPDLIDFRCTDSAERTLSLTNVLFVAGAKGRCLGCCGENARIEAVNCTFTGVKKGSDTGRIYSAYTQHSGAAAFTNCIFWDNADGAASRLTGAEPVFVNCLTDTDPLWGDDTYFHPQSTAGRYDGGWFSGGAFVYDDAVDSPAIDAGVKTMSAAGETQPNGRLVNVGYDGGTAVASKSALGSDPVVKADALMIYAYAAEEIGSDGARVAADVASTGGGADPQVTLVWDYADRGTASIAAWGNSVALGEFAPWNLAAHRIAGAMGERVYYRFVAENAQDASWTDPVRSFSLGKLPTVAYGDLRRRFRTSAMPTAVLESDGNAETTVRLVWYPSDDPTAAVTNDYAAGAAVAAGTQMAWSIDGLQPGTAYTYQVFAANAVGETVLPVQTFTTVAADLPQTFCVGAEAGRGDGASWNDTVDIETALELATVAGDEIRLLAGEYVIDQGYSYSGHGGFILRGGYTGEDDKREGRSVIRRNRLKTQFRLFDFDASAVTFDGIGFEDGMLNSSGALGQAVRLQNSCTAVFTNCFFRNNGYASNSRNAGAYGGAIYANGGSLTVHDCNFSNNRIGHDGGDNVLAWGGAIYATQAKVALLDTFFYTNRTTTAHGRNLGGGALSFANCPDVVINRCIFDGNYVWRSLYSPNMGDAAWGGTAYIKGCPSVAVCDTVVKNSNVDNTSLAGASLAYVGTGNAFYFHTSTAAVSRTVIYCRDLPVKSYVGLVDIQKSALSLTNVLMVAGARGWCLGSYDAASAIDAVNCTLTGVKEPADGARSAAAYVQNDGTASFRNCLFWDNAGGAWQKAGGIDPVLTASMTATDPLWGDEVFCHPASPAGRYDGGWFTGGVWVTNDTALSPAVDRASGFAKLATEPQPNGCRINCGYDGNTEVASKSVLGAEPVPRTGALLVYAYPDVQETADGAVLNGDIAALSDGSSAARVYLVWDDEDRGTAAKTDWAHVIDCGEHAPWDVVAQAVTGFSGKISYRFVAEDGSATAWSDPVREFARAVAPTVVFDTAEHPFTHVCRTSARVHFELVSEGGDATVVWVAVAPADDPAASTDVYVSHDPIAPGKYAVDLSGLLPGVEYSVKVCAQNRAGVKEIGPEKFATVSTAARVTAYAAPAACGYGDGTGWENAATLADALAAASGGNGDTILMLAGDYPVFGFALNQQTNLTIRGGYGTDGNPGVGETVLTTEGVVSGVTDKRFFVINQSVVKFDGIVFAHGVNNGSDRYGQAVAVRGDSDLTIDNCAFRYNGFDSNSGVEWAYFYGGALAVQGGRLTVTDSEFTGNRLWGGNDNPRPWGGAICASDKAVVSIRNCVFDRNSTQFIHARDGGGGALAFFDNVQAEVADCCFTTNFARSSTGGSVYWPQEGYGPWGGTIYARGATLSLTDLKVVGGYAVNGYYKDVGLEHGGVFYFLNSQVAGANIEVRDGGATGYAENADISRLATGSIAVNGGTVALTNVLHAGTLHGPCVSHMGGSVELVNGTFAGAQGLGSGPFCGYLQYTSGSAGAAKFKNCIFWNNCGGFRCLTNENFTLDISYCDIEGEADASRHVFSADPLFTDAANGDWTLGKNSPCIAAGDRTGFSRLMKDLAGNPRVSGGIDLGPYQCGRGGFMVILR